MKGAIFTMALFVLMGCSGESARVATGPGSETSGVSARVTDSIGRPVAGAAVRVVALGRKWHQQEAAGVSAVLAREVTDAQGWVRFSVAGRDRVALELEDSLHAGRVEMELSESRTSQMRTSTGGRLRVTAKAGSEAVRSLVLAGTAYESRKGADGSWSFAGLPAGEYTIAARTDSGMALLGRVAIASGAALDTALAADVDSVLLDDFAFAPIKNRYGWLLGAGWWYTTTDAVYGDSSTVTPSDLFSARVPCPVGNCLSVGFAIDKSSAERFALIGVDLDRSFDEGDTLAHLADLSKISGVRFWAAGQGSIQIQIHFRMAAGGSGSCYQSFALQGAGRLHEILLSNMTCDPGIVGRQGAEGMTWLTQDDAQLVLGPVSLFGAGPRSVFPELQLGGVR